MIRAIAQSTLLGLTLLATHANAQIPEQVVDIPTRDGVTQRFILIKPERPVATVILFAGGHGGLQISPQGKIKSGKGNFLVRSRQLFAEQGLVVAVVDAPSDHQGSPYLSNFRQRPEHAADIKAVIAWLRQDAKLPVWLVGTSRGTQSAAYIATQLSDKSGPDGIVLTSTMLTDAAGDRAVPDMPLERITIPVLVVHHEQDACKHCRFALIPGLLAKLIATPRKELLAFRGGKNIGDACQAQAYHGFNGIESEVVTAVTRWIRLPWPIDKSSGFGLLDMRASH